MSDSKLRDLSMDFSVEIVNLVKYLRKKQAAVYANQMGRSGTSIGASIFEAAYAQNKKDYVSKLKVALKEASEAGYWFTLLHRTGYVDDSTFQTPDNQCASLREMLIASCKTAKANIDRNATQEAEL